MTTSTSISKLGAAAPLAAPSDPDPASFAAIAGVPSPELLTRLANELFMTPPGGGAAPPRLDALPTGAPPASLDAVGEDRVRALAATPEAIGPGTVLRGPTGGASLGEADAVAEDRLRALAASPATAIPGLPLGSGAGASIPDRPVLGPAGATSLTPDGISEQALRNLAAPGSLAPAGLPAGPEGLPVSSHYFLDEGYFPAARAGVPPASLDAVGEDRGRALAASPETVGPGTVLQAPTGGASLGEADAVAEDRLRALATSPTAVVPGLTLGSGAGISIPDRPGPLPGGGSPGAVPPGATSLALDGLSEEALRELAAPGSLAPAGLPAAPEALPLSSHYFLDEAYYPVARAAAPAAGGSPRAAEGRYPGFGHVPQNASFARTPFDPLAIRRDFPILEERVHGRRLVWLDNAATTQKPRSVIERLACYYEHENSNIHRAAHELAARSTDAYEDARKKVARFLKASSPDEIVFLRGTTEAINLVAQSWGRTNIGEGDEIVITHLEHHANIVPWQQLRSEKGARLLVAPVDDRGQVLLEEYQRLLGPRTKLVAFTQVSNALGTITPAREMIEAAHGVGARVLLDGAQAVSHMPVDVQSLDADWYVLSGHKVFAPTGIGALYGKLDLLNSMPPWQGGGNMIRGVTFERTIYQDSPARFEAGTGNIADAVGFGAALDYLERIGMHNVAEYEHQLLAYATHGLLTVPGLRLIGTAAEKAAVLSFVLDGFTSEEVGSALDQEGIAVRAGHHCAQPILRRFGLESTVRASLALYNTCADIDALVAALLRLRAARSLRRG